MGFLFTSESVSEGHPDKVCDQISDAVLDAIISQDPGAHVACETTATTGVVHVMGEISTNCYVDIAGIARLFTSPQGVEFCLAANFPNLATFRLFKRFNPEQYSFYIDAGNITLKNPKTAVLIGKTTATIKCDTCENHTVITMHGASATVLASGWAVVRTEAGVSTNIIRRTSDNAIIL